MKTYWELVVILALVGAFTGCTRNVKGDGTDVAEDVQTFEVAGEVLADCDALCVGKECGNIGACSCGAIECGMSDQLACNEETNMCECQPRCGPPPDFAGWECGEDGCGGSCGECLPETWCQLDEGQGDGGDDGTAGGTCVTCQDRCDELGLECGLWPTGIEELPECDCGTCETGLTCYEGTCDCVPDCGGKVCGDDGCDGDCGTCPGDQDICGDGACICQPECGGMICGDDGCGGQCGGACGPGLVCVDGDCVTCIEDDDCDDGLECTADACTNGECEYDAQDGPCDDSNKCTDEEGCVAGECVGDPIDCDDGNPCTVDSCEPASGCLNGPLTGDDCDGGTGECVDGECVDKVPFCPDGWTMLAGNCYRPFDPDNDSSLTWQDADAACAGFGGHLPSIHDEATNEFVKELVNKTNFTDDTTWIGLNDLALEGAWEWSDGTGLAFTAWEGGQPNNWGGCWFGSCPENCVAINDPMIGFGGWNDIECDKEHRFICMKPVDWK